MGFLTPQALTTNGRSGGRSVAQRAAARPGGQGGEWSWGQISVKVQEQHTPDQLRPTPRDRVAALVPTYRATALCDMELGGPNLACPPQAVKGLMLSELLNTKERKGFSKKCNFHLRSKILPKS